MSKNTIARYILNDAFTDTKKFGEDAIVVAQDYHKGKDKGNGKKFIAYKSWEGFWEKYITDLKKGPLAYYEIIQEDKPCKMYADMDWSKLEFPKDEEWVEAKFIESMRYVLEKNDPDAVELFDEGHHFTRASKENKGSIHYINSNVTFRTGYAHLQFMHLVKNYMLNDPEVWFLQKIKKGYKWGCFIDFSVYSKNRQMRLVYSSKMDQEGNLQRPLIPQELQAGKERDFIITWTEDENDTYMINTSNFDHITNITARREVKFDDDMLNQIVAIIPGLSISSIKDFDKKRGTKTIVTKATSEFKCNLCDHTGSHCNPYFVADEKNGIVKMRCHSATAEGKEEVVFVQSSEDDIDKTNSLKDILEKFCIMHGKLFSTVKYKKAVSMKESIGNTDIEKNNEKNLQLKDLEEDYEADKERIKSEYDADKEQLESECKDKLAKKTDKFTSKKQIIDDEYAVSIENEKLLHDQKVVKNGDDFKVECDEANTNFTGVKLTRELDRIKKVYDRKNACADREFATKNNLLLREYNKSKKETDKKFLNDKKELEKSSEKNLKQRLKDYEKEASDIGAKYKADIRGLEDKLAKDLHIEQSKIKDNTKLELDKMAKSEQEWLEKTFKFINKYAVKIIADRPLISERKFVQDINSKEPKSVLCWSTILQSECLKMYENYTIFRVGPCEPSHRQISLIKFWSESLESANNMRYYMSCHPNDNDNKGHNTFSGLNITREIACNEGDIEKGLQVANFIKKVWCRDNEEVFSYVIKWMAHLIQRPGDMIGTAVGIRGLEGSGKGFVIQMLMDIIGAEHTVQTMDADNVFGSFNSIIQNKFLCFLDEAIFAGDRSIDGKVKGLITEPTVTINTKGLPQFKVRNTVNLLASTNSDRIFNTSEHSRRNLILETTNGLLDFSDTQKNAIISIKAVHFAKYLYEVDLNNWVPSKIPVTEALFDQRLHSLSPINQWLYDAYLNATFELSLGKRVKINDLFEWYSTHDSYMKLAPFSRSLRKIVLPSNKRELFRDAGRVCMNNLRYSTVYCPDLELLTEYLKQKNLVDSKYSTDNIGYKDEEEMEMEEEEME